MTSPWLAEQVARITLDASNQAPMITANDVVPIIPDLDLWDMWPLLMFDGTTAKIDGGTLWMILSAPKFEQPHMRHDHARIRLLLEKNGTWQDCGNLFPDCFAPGTREWSGSALYNPANAEVTVFYTVAGARDCKLPDFAQRLFQTTGKLHQANKRFTITQWSTSVESVVADGILYTCTKNAVFEQGFIKGFRDPTYFCDPTDQQGYLLFTGSLPNSVHSHNGVIGIARADGNGWQLLPPLVSGDGLSNELERAQILFKNNLYYLFWSTAKRVFAPHGPQGPTGLYGMVSNSMSGPWRPLNGTSLVIANPASEPDQAYCWYVMDDLRVVSFIDLWGVEGKDISVDSTQLRKHFGGTLAPMFSLVLDGERTTILI